MKRFTAIVLVLLAGFCTAGRLRAQTTEVRANIPFSFFVGNKLLPSGNYRFFPQHDELLVIQNLHERVGVLSHIADLNGPSRDYPPHLTFLKFGDRYFLSEIHCASVEMNGEIPRSKLERQAQVEEASLAPQRIELAAY
jgi:hypothetical protein